MSLTTGEVIARLPKGMSVTPAFIESLGIKPAESVKGKPKWAESDLPKIREKMRTALDKMDCSASPAPAADDDDL